MLESPLHVVTTVHKFHYVHFISDGKYQRDQLVYFTLDFGSTLDFIATCQCSIDTQDGQDGHCTCCSSFPLYTTWPI